MALQKSGPLLYVNMRDKNQIGVIERRSRSVAATWELQKVAHNTPLAVDETNHRLFVRPQARHIRGHGHELGQGSRLPAGGVGGVDRDGCALIQLHDIRPSQVEQVPRLRRICRMAGSQDGGGDRFCAHAADSARCQQIDAAPEQRTCVRRAAANSDRNRQH